MKRSLTFTVAATLTVALLMLGWAAPRPALSQSAASYTFTDLGILNPGMPYAVAHSINNAGQIAGESGYPDGNIRSFRISPATVGGQQVWFQDANGDGLNDLMQVLSLPNRYHASFGRAINTGGQIGGEARGGTNTLPQNAFFFDANGAGQATTSAQSWGYGINDSGAVVGTVFPNSGPYYGALWMLSKGKWSQTNLGILPGYVDSHAWAINGSGQIAGAGFLSGVGYQSSLWLPAAAYGLAKGLNSLGTLSGQRGNSAAALNNLGQVAGSSDTGVHNGAGALIYHAYLWLPAPAYGLSAGMNDIHDAANWEHSEAYGANQALNGVLHLVGRARGSNGDRAFVWDSVTRTMSDLNTVTANLPAGYVLDAANAVNDNGQIVGTAEVNGTTRAIVLNPGP